MESTENSYVARDPIPAWFFVVVVVRKDDQYLLVHEVKHGETWYLPAGRVELGETLVEAALRETLEEAGVPIRVTGLIRIEHNAALFGSRVRVVYLAEPVSDVAPKSVADEESLGAAWVRPDQLSEYQPLRDHQVRELIDYVEKGGAIYPIDIICPEGEPFRTR